MPPGGHTHTVPVDPSLSSEVAWRELCIFGRRVTYTGEPAWAVVACDGEECRAIEREEGIPA